MCPFIKFMPALGMPSAGNDVRRIMRALAMPNARIGRANERNFIEIARNLYFKERKFIKIADI